MHCRILFWIICFSRFLLRVCCDAQAHAGGNFTDADTDRDDDDGTNRYRYHRRRMPDKITYKNASSVKSFFIHMNHDCEFMRNLRNHVLAADPGTTLAVQWIPRAWNVNASRVRPPSTPAEVRDYFNFQHPFWYPPHVQKVHFLQMPMPMRDGGEEKEGAQAQAQAPAVAFCPYRVVIIAFRSFDGRTAYVRNIVAVCVSDKMYSRSSACAQIQRHFGLV